MKRKNKSEMQSEAKRKWEAQKEASKNWPPFPLKVDCAYSGSQDPERILCAFEAVNWLIDVAFDQEHKERGVKGLWHSELYQEQYIEALREVADINITWTELGVKLPTVLPANNTNRLNKEDFFDLRRWFEIVCQLVNADIQAHKLEAIGIAEDETITIPQIKNEQDTPVDDKELTIITELAEGSDKTFIQVEIAAATGIKRGTLKDKLLRLEQIGLVYRPLGKRKGYKITEKGKEIVKRNE